MPEFKVGDRIRINLPKGVEGICHQYYGGDEGVIIRDDSYMTSYRVRFTTPHPTAPERERLNYAVKVHEMELLNPDPAEALFS